MRTLLSSEALPGVSPYDLARACRRRALAGLEASLDDVPAAMSVRYEHYMPVPWLRLGATMTTEAVTAAETLGAGLLITSPLDAGLARTPLALVHGTDRDDVTRAVDWAAETGASTAWHLRPQAVDVSQVDAVLALTRETLAHVRLIGSGPESGEDDVAVAHLMVELALSGYSGTIALAPSPGADLHAWHRWLFKTRGWGCGSAHEKRVRRQLQTAG